MRAAILDQRIAGTSYGWEGARNASPSVQRVNGAVVRRNLCIDPRQARMTEGVTVTVEGEFGPFSTAAKGRINSPWKAFSTGTLIPGVTTDTLAVARFWLSTQSMVLIQNISENITITPTTWGGTLYLVDTMELMPNGRPLVDGVLREYVLSFTIPATQTTDWQFGFRNEYGDAEDRGDIYITGVCVEVGSAAIRPYFDGDTQVNAATINEVTPL